MKKRIHQIELFVKYPHEVQEELLLNLVKRASQTSYGQKHGFESINNRIDFQKNVPVVNYEELYPEIERLLKGEHNVLWPTEVKWFAKSSGTTNARSKFIPISQEALDNSHFKAGKDMLSMYFTNYPESKMMSGKGLVIGGSQEINPLDNQNRTLTGDLSAILVSNLPWWAQMIRTPSMETALMSEWEAKIEKMAEESARENVTSISGVPTWTIVLIEKLVRDNGVKNILELWPNLEVFFHGAVAFGPYEKVFQRLVPKSDMNYMETYNASEGFFGLQDRTDSKDLLLMLDYGIYYEFIPLNELEKEEPKVLTLDQIEAGQVYALLITTNAGLWRYKIGDTVKVTSTNPYRIRVAGRTKHFINAFGEELMIENAERAIAYACELTLAEIDNFTAAPHYLEEGGKKGGHEWIIEFIREPNDIDRFRMLLDEKLREVNSDYDAKRHKDIALIAPKIHVAPYGTFMTWMKKRGKLGGQNKVPRLSNQRDYLEDLLQVVASN
ncbi:MAG: GH3 auxin-responsive promoter family protein [Cyclobacteriaceae bacterium]